MRTWETTLSVALLLGGSCSNEEIPRLDTDGSLPDATSRDGGDASTTTDAQAGTCHERIECVGAPFGCRYTGGDGCTSCGSIVCEDAAVVSALDAGRDAAPSLQDAASSPQDGAVSRQDAAMNDEDASLQCGTDSFPSFSRVCQSQADCIVVEHQINCCGTRLAIGVRSDVRAAFEAAEATCRSRYPACGCAELATRADDGTAASGSAEARVDCIAGTCATSFLSAVGGSCSTGEAPCGQGYSCCYPCGIPGCTSVCTPSCAPGTPACANGCRQVP
jgi:hypothetical protein